MTAQARRLAAHLAARAGDRDAAAEHWRAAWQLMNEAGVVFDAAVLALEADADADALRADAIATLERLRATAPAGRGARPAWR